MLAIRFQKNTFICSGKNTFKDFSKILITVTITNYPYDKSKHHFQYSKRKHDNIFLKYIYYVPYKNLKIKQGQRAQANVGRG